MRLFKNISLFIKSIRTLFRDWRALNRATYQIHGINGIQRVKLRRTTKRGTYRVIEIK